jgi:hypothetical protein
MAMASEMLVTNEALRINSRMLLQPKIPLRLQPISQPILLRLHQQLIHQKPQHLQLKQISQQSQQHHQKTRPQNLTIHQIQKQPLHLKKPTLLQKI